MRRSKTDNWAVGVPQGGEMGPGRPVSYAGTQLNFYADAASDIAHSNAAEPLRTYPYGYAYPPGGYSNTVQMGLVTEHMLRKLDESRMLTMAELMARTGGGGHPSHAQAPPPQPPALTAPTHSALSPGHGDWKGQVGHIAGHLGDIASEDRAFRRDLAEPRLGEVPVPRLVPIPRQGVGLEITAADLEELDSAFVLTLKFAKPRTESREPRSVPRSTRAVEAKVKTRRDPEATEYEKENYPQEGTLRPAKPFNPEDDANVLRKAMKGLGTDEAAITGILGKRAAKQRVEIAKTYKSLFGKDLGKDLKGELSGNYWKVIRYLLLSPPDYDATLLRDAIKGLGTDDDCVIEVICTRTNKSIQLIIDSYKRLYNRSLEEDIVGDTSGHYQRLLVSLLQAKRDESSTVDRKKAKKEAEELYAAGPRRWGTDESKFNSVLVNRSGAQLRATFAELEKITGHHVDDIIKSECSGDLAAGLLTIVRCVNDKPRYFARQLYKAMKGAGTDDDTLIRIIVSRAEIDLVQIKEAFHADYRQPLPQFIQDDVSGDYAEVLLTLLGGRRGSSSRQALPHSDDDSDY